MLRRLTPLAGLLALCALAPAAHAQVEYTFTRIADTSGPFRLFFYPPSLNNGGTVAIAGLLRRGSTNTDQCSVCTGNGAALTTIATMSMAYHTAINDAGVVAFSGYPITGNNGVFTGNGGAITTIVDVSGPYRMTVPEPAINNGGTVVFHATLDAFTANRKYGIFTGNGGALTKVIDSSGPFLRFGTPSINSGGSVAFTASFDTGGNDPFRDDGVFLSRNGVVTTVADSNGPFDGFFRSTCPINEAGTIAFRARLDAGGEGIFTGNGGAVTTIADTNGPFASFTLDSYAPQALSINAGGTVAFYATLDEGGGGIFIGPDPIRNRVICVGDRLDGSIVTRLEITARCLNDAGQVAFVAYLADGRQGVYRADPTGRTLPLRFDLLGEGRDTILWQNASTGDVTWWRTDGTSWTGEWGYVSRGRTRGWKLAASADLDGDKNPDLIWHNPQTGEVTYWLMDGTEWTGAWGVLARGIPASWELAATLDINADSQADLIWRNTTTGDVLYWRMDGLRRTGEWLYIARGVSSNWRLVGAADVTGNGQADLIWQDMETGDVTYWQMRAGVWPGGWGYLARNVPAGRTLVGLPDLDGDQHADLLWRDTINGDLSVWRMYLTSKISEARVGTGIPADWNVVGLR